MDKSREAFEKHIIDLYHEIGESIPDFTLNTDGEYVNDEVFDKYITWQAACEHQKEVDAGICLSPVNANLNVPKDSYGFCARNKTAHECAKAIREQGE